MHQPMVILSQHAAAWHSTALAISITCQAHIYFFNQTLASALHAKGLLVHRAPCNIAQCNVWQLFYRIDNFNAMQVVHDLQLYITPTTRAIRPHISLLTSTKIKQPQGSSSRLRPV
jgi:hypothetical protein